MNGSRRVAPILLLPLAVSGCGALPGFPVSTGETPARAEPGVLG